MRCEKPQHDLRGRAGLPDAVRGANGDALVIAYRFEQLPLFRPRVECENVPGEADWIVDVRVYRRVSLRQQRRS